MGHAYHERPGPQYHHGVLSEDVIIRSGYVVTMDPALGDLPEGDVLVTGGRIAAVGAGLDAAGARELDARGMIVAPGLVDTHWHLWNTLLRSMSGGMPGEDRPAGYFSVSLGLGQAFTDQDNYQGTLLACAEAINSGITTVHDWSHNVRGPAHAEAELRALAEAGLRARYSYGYSAGHPNDQAMDTGGLRALHRDWPAWNGPGAPGRAGLLTLGMACRGLGGSNPAMRVPPGVYQREMAAARDLGLPVTVHASGPPAAAGQIAALAADGLLGPDLQVVHANSATPAEIAQLAEAGCAVSLSPFSELLIGYGLPQTAALLAAGIPVGLSVDTTALTGNADMFAIMKLTQGLINATAHEEFACTARQALALGTIGGARSLGLDGVTGSLTPGKRADLILVDTGHPNLGVLTDPAGLLVSAAQPANVDTVLADGQILKRGGALVTLDSERISAQAREALARVRARAA
jgi:cytosine/adenosine deaminase-related metal-dependent hydrolase